MARVKKPRRKEESTRLCEFVDALRDFLELRPLYNIGKRYDRHPDEKAGIRAKRRRAATSHA